MCASSCFANGVLAPNSTAAASAAITPRGRTVLTWRSRVRRAGCARQPGYDARASLHLREMAIDEMLRAPGGRDMRFVALLEEYEADGEQVVDERR